MLTAFAILLSLAGASDTPKCVAQKIVPRDTCFSEDFFSRKAHRLAETLKEFAGKPGVRGLEVGPFEGLSSIWFAREILSGEKSRLTTVDSFSSECRECAEAEARFHKNVEGARVRGRIELVKGLSQDVLKTLTPATYDWAFIDGDSVARARLMDAMLAWDLLKTGGVLIIDDYRRSPKLWLEQRPKLAIDTFVTMYRDRFEVIRFEEELVVRKLEPCAAAKFLASGKLKFFNASHCARFGRYDLYLKGSLLFDRADDKMIPLSESETRALLTLLKGRPAGDPYFKKSAVLAAGIPKGLKETLIRDHSR